LSKGTREAAADWLMVTGAPILMGSLFLTWSHQFSRQFLLRYAGSSALQGVPRDPTAWQVYSAVDVLLALLAAALLAVGLRGTRTARIFLALGLAVALAFTIHALSVPPTNGAVIFDSALGRYAPNSPTAGAGETLGLAGIVLGLVGVLISFTVD
jgi:hypothetical protein